MSRFFIARFATELFFPQRLALRIDGRSYSPTVLERLILCSSSIPSFELAAKLAGQVTEIHISGRHLQNLTTMVGQELVDDRDTSTAEYHNQPLPRERTCPGVPIALACVSIDGGRMQTRLDRSPSGVHSPHWRETKNALFLRMNGVSFPVDPHPELPRCYADRHSMQSLLPGLEKEDSQDEKPDKCSLDWRPEKLFRTSISSLVDSQAFGKMMAAEADSRGFYCAQKQAFVCDGLPYNWTIHEQHFRNFTPILDFVHAIEHSYAAARASTEGNAQAWDLHLGWTTLLWQGEVEQVLDQLRSCQESIGLPPKDVEEKDPRKVLADTIRYFQNNTSRMDYPKYRKECLPTTSAHMESLVKEVNYRVKGTEKFWNDGPKGEAILQVRAATLSEDDRLPNHLKNRPGDPLQPNVKKSTPLAIAS